MITPRLLKADEIEVRVGTINDKGATLLLYKDSRTDQNVLDETFGAENWQRDHKELKGNIYAGVGVWDDDKKQWVWKWDAGSESNQEAVKGEASDSFKRAAFNWGVGRELYTSPFVWVTADKYSSYKNKAGKMATYDKFHVEKIRYDNDRNITGLAITNTKTGKLVFTWTNEV